MKKEATYSLDISHGGKRYGTIEHLAPSVSLGEVQGLVRGLVGLGEDKDVTLLLKGGRKLPPEGGLVLGEVAQLKPGKTQVLVVASTRERREEPVDRAGNERFAGLEERLKEAEERFGRREWDGALGEERRRQLLWFNGVVELMTQADTLKQTCRVEYDRNDRGRKFIRRCTALLDRVEQERLM